VPAAQLLLARGAPTDAQDHAGKTPYDTACGTANLAMRSLLRPDASDAASAMEARRRAAITGGSGGAGASGADLVPSVTLTAPRGVPLAVAVQVAPQPVVAPAPAVAAPAAPAPAAVTSPRAGAASADVAAGLQREVDRLRSALEEAEQRRAADVAEADEARREAAQRAAAAEARAAEAEADAARSRASLAAAEAAAAAQEAAAREAAAQGEAERQADASAARAAADAAAREEPALLAAAAEAAADVAGRSAALSALPAAAAAASAALRAHAAAGAAAQAVSLLRRCGELIARGGDAAAAAAAEAGAALDAADASGRALDATRAATRRALAAAAMASPSSAVADAVAARDVAEDEHKRCLAQAADACSRLARRQRGRAAAAADVRAAADAAAAAAAAACDESDVMAAAPAPAVVSSDSASFQAARAGAVAALRATVPALAAAAAAAKDDVARAVASLQAEAALAAAAAPALAAALSAAACAAAAAADAVLAAEAPGNDDAAAEALGAQRAAELQALRSASTARAAAAAAAPRLAAAEDARVRALQALLDLAHERSTAQLKREWSAEREARYTALKTTLDADAAAADAAASEAEAALRAPAVRELYPELAAGADAAAAAAAMGLRGGSDDSASDVASTVTSSSLAPASPPALAALVPSSSPSPFALPCSRDGLEDVEVLQRTQRCTVTRVRERGRAPPTSPSSTVSSASSAASGCAAGTTTDRVLKSFPSADSAFLAEARHLAAARHPLVCELLAAFVDGGRAHLLMPFYAGGCVRPFFEALKAKKGDLSGADWAAVRRTFRQLLQALAFCHGRGIAHRDVKPENVLWREAPGGRIALADFGLSRDLSRRLETTRAPGEAGGGTPLYAAPETLEDAGGGASNWKEAPWAVDVYSVGIMALELACGEAVAWAPARQRVEPVGGGGRALALPPPPRGGAPMGDFLALALACAAPAAEARPSADEALLHPFFFAEGAASDAQPPASTAASAGDAPPPLPPRAVGGAKLAMVGALLGELRVAARATARVSSGAPSTPLAGGYDAAHEGGAFVLAAAAGDALLPDVLAAAAACNRAALAAPWAARLAGQRAPLSELLARAFAAAAAPGAALLVRGPEGTWLPSDAAPSSADAASYRPLGMLLGKCLLEGVPCGLDWAPLLYAALLGRDDAAMAQPAAALAHWASWDAACAGTARAALARAPPGDASARDAALAAARAALAPRRRAAALAAMRAGFGEAARAGGLAPALALLDEWELGALFFAGAYVDTAELRASLLWDDVWPADDPQRAFFNAFLERTPETALRLLLARATGRLTLRPGDDVAAASSPPPPIVVLRAGAEEAPEVRFPGNRVIALPPACADGAEFDARMRAALGLHAAPAAAAAAAAPAPPAEEELRCRAGHAWRGAPGSACAECAVSTAAAAACCVCLGAPRATLLLPCRHLCVCNACGTHVVERGTARCPLCRAFIQARVMDCFL